MDPTRHGRPADLIRDPVPTADLVLLDGDTDVDPCHRCVRSSHIKMQTGPVSDPRRDRQMELVRQES